MGVRGGEYPSKTPWFEGEKLCFDIRNENEALAVREREKREGRGGRVRWLRFQGTKQRPSSSHDEKDLPGVLMLAP